jgi:hypothetical protein
MCPSTLKYSLCSYPISRSCFIYCKVAAFDTSHIAVINDDYNSSIVSEQTLNNTMAEKNEVASTPSEILTSLNKYIEDESNRQEWVFTCPYCPDFETPLEIEYQRHIVLIHPGKTGYPNMASRDSEAADRTTSYREADVFTSVQT